LLRSRWSLAMTFERVFQRPANNTGVHEITLLAAVFLVFLYAAMNSAYPAFANDDSPETIAASYTLGIQHPPGYPLFTMLGKIFLTLHIGAPAINMNFFSCFLAAVLLACVYFTARRLSAGSLTAGIFAMAALALSGTFFSQAISAKGGIYMLNLILLNIMLACLLDILKNKSIKAFYICLYAAGLSLANHWQSSIILVPLFAAALFIRVKPGPRRAATGVIFFILGLTPYIFILLRGMSHPVMNHGAPDNLTMLFKHILRSNYAGENAPFGAAILAFQASEFFRAVISSFSPLWVIALLGMIRAVYLKDKKAVFTVFILVINALSVIFFFRRRQDSACYYLPSVYALALFTPYVIAGISGFKNAAWKTAGLVAAFLLAGISVPDTAKYNMMSGDYLAYDYANNLLAPFEKDSTYFAVSGFDIMPLYYTRLVEKKRADIKVVETPYLRFDWGREEFKAMFGKEITGSNAVKEAVSAATSSGPVYAGFDDAVAKRQGLKYSTAGISIKLNSKLEPDFYPAWRLRGVYNGFFLENPDTFSMISNYAGSLVNHANELMTADRLDAAIACYARALLLPYNGSKAGFYQDIALAYKKKGIIINAKDVSTSPPGRIK
jgi:hypothetical protein